MWNSGEPFDPAALGPADRYQGPVPIRCEPAGGGNCRVAVVLDNAVITAPQITDVITGPAQITGNFTENQAQRLATQLRFGPLPLVLTVESVEYQPPAG